AGFERWGGMGLAMLPTPMNPTESAIVSLLNLDRDSSAWIVSELGSRPSDRRSDRGDALDLHQEVRVEELLHHDERAGRQLAREDFLAGLGHGRTILDLRDVGRDLHEIVEVAAGGLEHAAHVLKHLAGPGARVAFAHDGAAGVPRHLSRDVEQAAALHAGRPPV